MEVLRDFCAATQNADLSRQSTIDNLASQLISIPALYHVVHLELKKGSIQGDTLGVCRWLYIRGAMALKTLLKYPAPGVEISAGTGDPEKEWQKVFICIS